MKSLSFLGNTILFAYLFIVGCGNKNTEKTKTNNDSTVTTTDTSHHQKKEVIVKPKGEMIVGKWQHIEDKSNFLVFENNHRKEIAGDSKKWDDEEYILADKCMNPNDKKRDVGTELGAYISLVKSDMCWYIQEVTEDSLWLSYTGRGNTLIYTRVK